MGKLRIRDLSGLSIAVFGALALLLGLIGLIQPETTLSLLGFELLERGERAAGDYTVTFLLASSMASFNVGVYYVLAALHNLRQFYLWTVPFRMLTFTVFTLAALSGVAPQGFIGVAVWELIGALLTGAALWYERGRAAD